MSVFHVSYNGDSADIKTGVLSSSTMNSKNPSIYLFMETQETDFCSFEKSDGQVIVTRESSDQFRDSTIQ